MSKMAENKERNTKNTDVRPKTSWSRSADRKDGYVWSRKKLSWSKKSDSGSDAETASTSGKSTFNLRNQERKHSCSSTELDVERSCGHRLLGRSLKQKLQDAVGQCFPIKNCSSRHSSVLPSKRKIHISKLMLDKCPFPPQSKLAFHWHLIEQHTAPIKQKSESWLSVASSHSEGKDGEAENADGGGSAVLQPCYFSDGASCSCSPQGEPATDRQTSPGSWNITKTPAPVCFLNHCSRPP